MQADCRDCIHSMRMRAQSRACGHICEHKAANAGGRGRTRSHIYSEAAQATRTARSARSMPRTRSAQTRKRTHTARATRARILGTRAKAFPTNFSLRKEDHPPTRRTRGISQLVLSVQHSIVHPHTTLIATVYGQTRLSSPSQKRIGNTHPTPINTVKTSFLGGDALLNIARKFGDPQVGNSGNGKEGTNKRNGGSERD
eukprot:76745-Pleurochrysis_carterae.AAC.1